MKKPLVCIALAIAVPAYAAADAPTPAPALRTLDTVVVSGIRPGPGLWKVSRGEHVLWILGTVSPVPRGMEWYSPRTEAVLRQTQEIIGTPTAGVQVGWGSAFKMMFAVPAILRARELPDGKTLRDVLPADLHTRWQASRSRYLPNDDGVEQWRPMFAAGKLYDAALNSMGLQQGTGTGKRIDKLASEYRIRQTPNLVVFKVTDPRGLAKSFSKADIDEVACFRDQLDRLDQDLALAARRANAWAIGNIAELTQLVGSNHLNACKVALAKVQAVQEMGLTTAEARAKAQWLASVDSALEKNNVSFAALPMSELLEADGLLAKLRGKGYAVVAPE